MKNTLGMNQNVYAKTLSQQLERDVYPVNLFYIDHVIFTRLKKIYIKSSFSKQLNDLNWVIQPKKKKQII
jgi:hypothetical protein